MQMWGDLHEEKVITASLSKTIEAGEGNRLFRELGAKLHYDVYDFPAFSHENWQSESLLHVTLLLDGEKVYAQEDFNGFLLHYPLAARPSSDQQTALKLIVVVVNKFGASAIYNGHVFSESAVQSDWDSCNGFLLKEWGEEPGSKSLSIMIQEIYA